MTVITGNIQDIGLDPLSGVLIATSVEFRVTGDIIIAPEARTYPIEGGIVSADLIPGPTRLTVQVGTHARDSFDVIVPDEPVTLARLIEDAFEWSPAVVSAVAADRAAAEAAALRAESAAGDVDSAIAGAADAVVAAVESDRVAAEAAAGAAASSASDADGSAGDAAVAAGAASQSASNAAGSASAAAGSASAASGSATSAAGSATDAAGAVTDARTARDAAEGHATSAAGSASAAASSATAADGHADRAEAAANEFGLTATSSTLAPGAAATVTVSGDGPAYSLAFGVPQGPKGDKGDEGEISQAQLDAAVASLVDNAPEALNTLSELSTALGDDPNFATTVSTQIGQKVSGDDPRLSDARTPLAHTHPVTDLAATGTRSSSTYLRGDGSWATPTNTTYTVMSEAEATAGTATTARTTSAAGLKGAIQRWATGTYSTAISAIGQALNRAATAADARNAIGAGTSNLAIGTTSTTAKAGNWTPGINEVTGLDSALSGKAAVSHTHTAAEVGAEPESWSGTQAQFDALGTKNPNRTYYIV